MHVGSNGKRSKTEAIYCPARTATYGDGDTSDLVLNCGGTVSFTESYVYLGSLLYYDQCLTDHHDVEARITRVLRVRSVSREEVGASAGVLKAPSPSGSRERCTQAASWRSCCAAASRGASRQSRCGG